MSLTRHLLTLAWPVLIGHWAAVGFGVIDTAMTGHASARDLAAVAIGSAIYMSIFVGVSGVVMALNPVIAHHFGALRHDEIGKTWFQGVWLALWMTLIGLAALAFPDVWLTLSKVTPEVRQALGAYLQALAFALPAALLFRSMYAFNTAVARPKIVMAINLLALACKVPLNYVLIFGKFGLPALGAAGCGIATAIVLWLSCIAGYVVMRRDPFYARFAIRFDWPRWPAQSELLRLGVPMGLSHLVEVTSFTFMALLAARLGTQVTGGHQIAANLAALGFMMPLSLAISTSTLTAHALGAGDAQLARRTAFAGLRVALSAAILFSATLWLGRDLIVGLYTSDATIAAIAFGLMPFLAFFHIFDALQAVSGFALRAYRRPYAPLITYSLALWGIGLGGGFWIAFYPVIDATPMGARGLWLAASVSLAIASAILVVYLGIITLAHKIKHMDEKLV